jgi:hypothetical protein
MPDADWDAEFAKYQAASKDFTHLLGYALVAWQGVETELHSLYVVLANASEENNIIWHSINSLDIKIQIVSALVVHRNDAKTIAAWTTAENKLRRKKKLRDKLAHWHVLGNMSGGIYRGIYLTPPTTDFRNIRAGFTQDTGVHPDSMKADDIRQHTETFRKLSLTVRDVMFLALETLPQTQRAAVLAPPAFPQNQTEETPSPKAPDAPREP